MRNLNAVLSCALLMSGSLLAPVEAALAQEFAARPIAPAVLESLPRVVELARERAPAVLVANAQLETSRAAVVGAKVPALGNPYLELMTARGNHGITRDVEFSSALTLPVEIAGQRSKRIDEANAYVALHTADLERVRALAAGMAVHAWGMAACESARLQALVELTQSAQLEFDMLAARRMAGDATEQDVQMAAVELGRHRILVDEAKANQATALGLLERITGLEWSEPPSVRLQPPIDGLLKRNAVDVTQAPSVRTRRLEAALHDRSFARYNRETWSPLNLVVSGGRGDFGETRFGFGVGLNLPVIRRLQGEKARALAERDRATIEARVQEREIAVRLKTIAQELGWLQHALEELEQNTGPAATAAVRAATELRRLGKSDYLAVIVARREQSHLIQRRVDLSERQWSLLAEWVELVGRLPSALGR